MCYKIGPAIIFTLLLLINSSCAGLYSGKDFIYASDTATSDIKVWIFDGIHIRPAHVSEGEVAEALEITTGYYGVIFFTKKGSYPVVTVFRSSGRPLKMDRISFIPLKKPEKGTLTGVVYRPVAGGKLRQHQGIQRLFKGVRIEAISGSRSFTAFTDKNGLFMLSLPPGRYNIFMNGKDMGEVMIKAGEAVIKNLQRGIVLAD